MPIRSGEITDGVIEAFASEQSPLEDDPTNMYARFRKNLNTAAAVELGELRCVETASDL
jgi:hypothetical protein